MKKLLVLATVASIVTLGLVSLVPAGATGEDHQVVVCKYVGPPGSGEVLQTGNNPIVVDSHSLEGDGFNGTFPFVFSDAQSHSIAIRFAASSQDGSITECPGFVPPTTTSPPPPPPITTTTQPPPPPPTTTTTPPPPPPATTTQPPVTTTVTVPPNPNPVPCKGSVSLGPWYGDPRVNITLTGAGHFVVSGGVQRFTGLTTIDQTLNCGQVLRIGRYKVERGHYLTITLDSVLVTHIKPPRVR